MVIGLTFLFFCLVGPLALLIPLIAWIVSKQRSRERTDSAMDSAYAERFHELESGILGEPPPPSRRKRATRKRRPETPA